LQFETGGCVVVLSPLSLLSLHALSNTLILVTQIRRKFRIVLSIN